MTSLLQQLLVDAAERHPLQAAVDEGERSVTYEGLDRMSNRLARTLLSQGVLRGDRVGILARKSAASVVGVFAALKSGACYVPLDVASPDDRLAMIARDSDLEVILADVASAERALTLAAVLPRLRCVIAVDPLAQGRAGSGGLERSTAELVPWDAVLAEPGDAVSQSAAADTDLAYMLYTSGSTGVPKGVMISHRASLTFVEWAAACAGLDRADRVCSPAPLHFDLSVFDIFASCKAGACMVVLPAVTLMFPVRLAEWIQQQRITVWYSVPSVLTMLATHGKLGAFDLSRLATVIFAGEVFPAKHLSALMRQLPHARLLNWYGPTETNVCTWYEVPRGAGELTAPVPIGIPCANVEVLALTEHGERVSRAGQEGELLVLGPGLMSGYWHLPERTDEVLVRDPLQDGSHQPAYRTGDMVTLDEEGNYLFLGRIDGMVKTRGYRVEVGEVESALYGHPSVRDAVVTSVPDELLGNRLRAVVCIEREDRVTREAVLEHCRKRLPAYMVPDLVEFWEELPKTSTGKVDRVAIQSS